jgi:hypothetical protein
MHDKALCYQVNASLNKETILGLSLRVKEFLMYLHDNYFISFFSMKYNLTRIDDCISNSIIKEFRNNSSSVIIHEHDFRPIRFKGEEKQTSIFCLTCGLNYCEKCGKPLISTTRSGEKLTHLSNNLCNLW